MILSPPICIITILPIQNNKILVPRNCMRITDAAGRKSTGP